MSKGNDKKPKSDKSKPKTGVSPYKAAQSTGNPRLDRSPERPGVSRKPTANPTVTAGVRVR